MIHETDILKSDFVDLGFGLLATETDIQVECLFQSSALSHFYNQLRQCLQKHLKSNRKEIWWPGVDSVDWRGNMKRTKCLMANEVKMLGTLASSSECISLASDEKGNVWIIARGGSAELGRRTLSGLRGDSKNANDCSSAYDEHQRQGILLCDDYATLQREYLTRHCREALESLGLKFKMLSQIESVFPNGKLAMVDDERKIVVSDGCVQTEWGNVGVVPDTESNMAYVYLGIDKRSSVDVSLTVKQAVWFCNEWFSQFQSDDLRRKTCYSSIEDFWAEHRDSCYYDDDLWYSYQHEIWADSDEIKDRYDIPMSGTDLLQPLFRLNLFFSCAGHD